jgi:hypothetical protein
MDGEFVRALEGRKAGLEQLEPAWRLVDDVLASRVKAKNGDGWWSPYFPKGRLEPAGEYSLRVELTPFFPQTPGLLAARLGALFRTKLQVEAGARTSPPGTFSVDGEGETGEGGGDGFEKRAGRTGGRAASGTLNEERATAQADSLRNILRRAGRREQSFEDLAVQAACLAQSHGFCAALIDRDPLPEDARARDISQAEVAARGLGRAYIALFSAPQILDWEYGADGRLSWVKFAEESLTRPRWDAPAEPTRTVRVVDRSAIHVFTLRQNARGEWKAETQAPVAHGFRDRVPVVFLHPFPGADGIGRPILQRAAEADVASARILSDLVWDLFLLGNPILTLKTNRSESELARLGVGASRYIPLRNGRPGEENAEGLEFVQLDPTGIELLFRAHALFQAQAKAQAGGGEEAAAIPREQSGIAQAWRFKTGEERILFMLARALEPFLSACLELVLHAEAQRTGQAEESGGTDVSPVIVRLPDSFDIAASEQTLVTAERLVDLAERLGQTALARTALERVEAVLGALAPEAREAMRAERDALAL